MNKVVNGFQVVFMTLCEC